MGSLPCPKWRCLPAVAFGLVANQQRHQRQMGEAKTQVDRPPAHRHQNRRQRGDRRLARARWPDQHERARCFAFGQGREIEMVLERRSARHRRRADFNGLGSRDSFLAEQGEDFESVCEQLADEKQLAESYRLTFGEAVVTAQDVQQLTRDEEAIQSKQANLRMVINNLLQMEE